MIYDLGARANINGNTVVLSREIDNIEHMSYSIDALIDNFVDIKSFGSDDFRLMKTVCDDVSNSYFLSLIASEVLSSAAESWRSGEEFLGVAFPLDNQVLALMFDSVLNVFATTDETTVVSDLSTAIDIFALVTESEILGKSGYAEIMKVLDEENLVEKLTVLLEKNPRMAPISDALYRTAMQALVKTVRVDGVDSSKYTGLIENITGELNRLKGEKSEKKVEELTNKAIEYMDSYGFDVPDSVAEMVISTMISELEADEDGYIDPDSVKQFLENYAPAGN